MTILSSKQLQSTIMTRVWTVYLIRRATRPALLRVVLLVSATGLIVFKVSLINVFTNMPAMTDPSAVYTFYWNAFTQTEWLIKSLVLALTAIGLLVIKDSRAVLSPLASRINPYRLIRS